MKLCEYMNNLLSLDTLFKQNFGKIDYVRIAKAVFVSNDIIYYQSPIIYILRVEKEVHDPLYKIIGKHVKDEEYVDAFIKNFGMLPLGIEIGNIRIRYHEIYIFVEEGYFPNLFSEKLNKHTEKRIVVMFRGV